MHSGVSREISRKVLAKFLAKTVENPLEKTLGKPIEKSLWVPREICRGLLGEFLWGFPEKSLEDFEREGER